MNIYNEKIKLCYFHVFQIHIKYKFLFQNNQLHTI